MEKQPPCEWPSWAFYSIAQRCQRFCHMALIRGKTFLTRFPWVEDMLQSNLSSVLKTFIKLVTRSLSGLRYYAMTGGLRGLYVKYCQNNPHILLLYFTNMAYMLEETLVIESCIISLSAISKKIPLALWPNEIPMPTHPYKILQWPITFMHSCFYFSKWILWVDRMSL